MNWKMESSDENTKIVMMRYFHFETTHRKKYVHRNNFVKLSVRRAPTTEQYGRKGDRFVVMNVMSVSIVLFTTLIILWEMKYIMWNATVKKKRGCPLKRSPKIEHTVKVSNLVGVYVYVKHYSDADTANQYLSRDKDASILSWPTNKGH